MGHGHGAGLVLLAINFAIDLIAGATGAGHATRTLAAVRASTLSHETGDDPVEGEAVIEAVLGQFHEIGHRVGSVGLKQLELDLPCVGVHQSLGHGGASKIGV